MAETKIPLPQPVRTAVPSSAEIASDYVRTLVFTGVLRTGDKLPVDDIADVLGVSRQPVREALIELTHDGLVVGDGRRGTFVADFGPSTIRDHYDLYGLLYGYALRHVAQERDPDVLAALRAIEKQVRGTVDVADLTRLAIEFVRVVNRGAGNARLRQVMRAMTRFTPGEYYLGNVPEAVKRNRASLRRQLRAVEAGNPDDAAAAAITLWRETADFLIEHLVASGVFAAEQLGVFAAEQRTAPVRSTSAPRS
jgi:DNA-binding GntR family transcriptional regulator